METRKERFIRLAPYRANAILEKIRILGNLSNKTNYDYTDDEVNKIFAAIDLQLRGAKARFYVKRERKEFKF